MLYAKFLSILNANDILNAFTIILSLFVHTFNSFCTSEYKKKHSVLFIGRKIMLSNECEQHNKHYIIGAMELKFVVTLACQSTQFNGRNACVAKNFMSSFAQIIKIDWLYPDIE